MKASGGLREYLSSFQLPVTLLPFMMVVQPGGSGGEEENGMA